MARFTSMVQQQRVSTASLCGCVAQCWRAHPKLDFLFREDTRNLHMIRIFYMKSRVFNRVSYFFDCQKRAILTKTIRSFPSPSPSSTSPSPSPSPSHQFLRVTGTYTDFKGGTPSVDFASFLRKFTTVGRVLSRIRNGHPRNKKSNLSTPRPTGRIRFFCFGGVHFESHLKLVLKW